MHHNFLVSFVQTFWNVNFFNVFFNCKLDGFTR